MKVLLPAILSLGLLACSNGSDNAAPNPAPTPSEPVEPVICNPDDLPPNTFCP